MQEKIKRFLKVNKINEKQALVKFDKMAMKIAKQYSGKNEQHPLAPLTNAKHGPELPPKCETSAIMPPHVRE